MKLKFAIIGCGRISLNHITAAMENDLEIIALCDIDHIKMENIFNKCCLSEETKLYRDYKELISSEKIDLIAICTESGKHCQIALDCIEKGIHLIIEKPITLSLEDADQIIKNSLIKNIKVSTCHQNRFNKSIQKIKEAIDNKRFGKLFYGTAHIRWNRGKSYFNESKWRGSWSQDGGALMNQCIHNIDLLRWLMGEEIVEVVGMTDKLNHEYIEAEDFGIALVRFKNQSYGIIEGTTNIFPQNLEETLYIFGEKGTIKAGGQSVNTIEEWRFADMIDHSEQIIKEHSEYPPNVYGYGHVPLYFDMIDAIKNNREPYVTAIDGRNALELVLAIYKSSHEGKAIKFPMERCTTLEFEGWFD